jgi:molecular chaperone GrpE
LIFAGEFRYPVATLAFFREKAPMTDTAANNNTAPAAAAETAAPADAATLANEVAELKDKLLRALADMENLRRRTEREITEARTYAIATFAEDLVGAVDNMRRALDAASDHKDAMDGAALALVEGVELTERELLKVLEKHGVKKFDPKGVKFDPNLHQALFEVPDPEIPSGTVAQVIQAGYMIGDRVLRPARVGVSKGGPKPAQPERSADATA